MSTPQASFAQLLRHYRLKSNLTQQQTAEKVGVSTCYITLLETGKRNKPGWRIVSGLAKVFKLKRNERRAFIRSAGYSEDVVGKTTVDLSPPVLKALSRFLSLPAGSPDGTAALQESLKRVEAVVGEKGLSRRQKKAVKLAQIITSGFFSTTPDRKNDKIRKKKGATKELEIVLADRLREILEIFVEGSIPINKRIILADELISYLQWKISKEQS
jgi:transcriptional regulator with XRE-family HTH domain